jgi:hypothetical protein
MQMTKILLILTGLIVVAGAAVAAWASATYNYDRDHANQERIAKAYIAYFKQEKQFAPSLEALVTRGFLPPKGRFYKEPPRLLGGEISYKDSSYEVFEPKDGKVEDLRMIARKILREGKEQLEFEPMTNAMVRDEINQLRGAGKT